MTYVIVCFFLIFTKHILYSNITYSYYLWERPFDLKGGGLWFFYKKNILIPSIAEKIILILVEEKKII